MLLKFNNLCHLQNNLEFFHTWIYILLQYCKIVLNVTNNKNLYSFSFLFDPEWDKNGHPKKLRIFYGQTKSEQQNAPPWYWPGGGGQGKGGGGGQGGGWAEGGGGGQGYKNAHRSSSSTNRPLYTVNRCNFEKYVTECVSQKKECIAKSSTL